MFYEEKVLVDKIRYQNKLNTEEAYKLFLYILTNDNKKSNMIWGALFANMMSVGCSCEEISEFISAIKDFEPNFKPHFSEKHQLKCMPLCITGSGKEDFKTVNISTMAALLIAAYGYKVLKPSSSSVSAVCGSLDIIENLGLPTAHSIEELDKLFEKSNFVGFDFEQINSKYASRYSDLFSFFHPLSYIMPALAIPVKMSRIVYGISDENIELTDTLLKMYGYPEHVVVTGLIDTKHTVDELYPPHFKCCGLFNDEELNNYMGTIFINPEQIRQKDTIIDSCNVIMDFMKGEANESIINMTCANATLMICRSDCSDTKEIFEKLKRFVMEKQVIKYYNKLKRW